MKASLPVLISAFFCSSVWAGPVIEVRNAEGKALMIELLALEGDNVVFATTGGKAKEHTLGILKFDTDSQGKIREEAKALPPRVPKLDIEVVVSKRREKRGYYMVDQEVSAKVKLRNLSARIPFPATKAAITKRPAAHPHVILTSSLKGDGLRELRTEIAMLLES